MHPASYSLPLSLLRVLQRLYDFFMEAFCPILAKVFFDVFFRHIKKAQPARLKKWRAQIKPVSENWFQSSILTRLDNLGVTSDGVLSCWEEKYQCCLPACSE
jgi:hypothetical protein